MRGMAVWRLDSTGNAPGMQGRSPLPGASAPDRNRPCEVDRQQRQPEGDEAERYGDLEQREDEAQRGEESKHAQ